MRNYALSVIGAVVAAILISQPTIACSWSRHPKNQNIILFHVEKAEKDDCVLSSFPTPFNKPIPFLQGPNISEFRWAYADQQYGIAQIRILADGSGEFAYMFSNGRKWDGDTFCATTLFLTKEGTPIFARGARAGVNSALGHGGARERWIRFPLNETPRFWNQVAIMRFSYQMCGKYNDSRIWEAIVKNAYDVVRDPSVLAAGIAAARIAAEFKQE